MGKIHHILIVGLQVCSCNSKGRFCFCNGSSSPWFVTKVKGKKFIDSAFESDKITGKQAQQFYNQLSDSKLPERIDEQQKAVLVKYIYEAHGEGTNIAQICLNVVDDA